MPKNLSILAVLVVSLLSVINPVWCFLLDTTGQRSDTKAVLPDLAELPLRIGSFNIQVFGRTKNSSPAIVQVLVKILCRYDIVQILEIRDIYQTEFESLRTAVNSYVKAQGGTYVFEKVVSARLGRTASKEQYGFLYRTDKVQMTDTYQFPDKTDLFEREPFGVRFKSSSTVVDDFGLVAIHVQPSNALQEIGNLTTVYGSFKNHWNLANIIVAGDFNADCNYISVGELQDVSFRQDKRFYWAIQDNVDTSVTQKHCSYDKFVIAGDSLINTVVPGSAEVYRFDEELSLSTTEALRVSDHYPVEISLAGKPFPAMQSGIESSIGFTVKDTHQVSNINDIRAMYRKPSCVNSNYTVQVKKVDTHMDTVIVSTSSSNTATVLSELINFSKICPGTLSVKLLATVDAYLKSDYLSGQLLNVYGLILSKTKTMYETVITCSLVSPYICKINVSLKVSG